MQSNEFPDRNKRYSPRHVIKKFSKIRHKGILNVSGRWEEQVQYKESRITVALNLSVNGR